MLVIIVYNLLQIWPAVQAINFTFVPVPYRYEASISRIFCWQTSVPVCQETKDIPEFLDFSVSSVKLFSSAAQFLTQFFINYKYSLLKSEMKLSCHNLSFHFDLFFHWFCLKLHMVPWLVLLASAVFLHYITPKILK